MRIGTGYDVHKLVEGRKLILGGVEVPHTLGLLGHSDADVLLHAIMDAILGAAGLGDIGKHFPDTDEAYRGISSMKLLEHVGALIADHGYVVGNIDATGDRTAAKTAPLHQPDGGKCSKRARDFCGSGSISKQRLRSIWDLPEEKKAFLLRQSVCWNLFMRAA